MLPYKALTHDRLCRGQMSSTFGATIDLGRGRKIRVIRETHGGQRSQDRVLRPGCDPAIAIREGDDPTIDYPAACRSPLSITFGIRGNRAETERPIAVRLLQTPVMSQWLSSISSFFCLTGWDALDDS